MRTPFIRFCAVLPARVLSQKSIFVLVVLFLLSAKTQASDFTQIRQQIEKLTSYRITLLEQFERFQKRLKIQKGPLSGGQLLDVHQSALRHYQLQKQLWDTVDFVDLKKFSSDEPLPIEFIRTLGVCVSLMDHTLEAWMLFENDSRLRRIINEGNSIPGKPKNILRDALDFFKQKNNRKLLAHSIAAYSKDIRGDLSESYANEAEYWHLVFESSTTLDLLDQLPNRIVDFEVFTQMKQGKLSRLIKRNFKDDKKWSDLLFKIKRKLLYGVSKTFGNTMGLVAFRKGHLYNSDSFEQKIQSQLKPFDILLEKTPFRLTDKFIPGYWGHNAIYIGNETQLKELGLWEHPLIVPLQSQIKQGKTVVEALRPGTQINTIKHFLNIDSFAVIRRLPSNNPVVDLEKIKNGILISASQVGKKYDFNFDVETQDQLVCSELIYMAYTDVPWRTKKSLKRWTIKPDAVAERALPGYEFDVAMLIVDGVELKEDLRQEMAKLLLGYKLQQKMHQFTE